jgi:hypothetical protein
MTEAIKEVENPEGAISPREQPYIKLSKNSRGHNWDIKALDDTSIETLKEIKERVLQINQELVTELIGD